MRSANRLLLPLLLLPDLLLAEPPGTPEEQVFATERAFAASMAQRDFAAFQDLLSTDAIFFGGPRTLRGKQAVIDGWKPFFAGAAPPFSWEPDQVEVLASGDLALSTGPVFNPQGQCIGRFNSIWRLEPDGHWRIVFDKGEDQCGTPPKSP